MAEVFTRIMSEEPVPPDQTFPIRPLKGNFLFGRETPGASKDSCRPFVNDSLNSRLAVELPNGPWKIAASADLEPGLYPKHILHSSDRILIKGAGPWQLFDTDCKALARGYLADSDLFIDSERGRFLCSGSSGLILNARLADGQSECFASMTFGAAFERVFIGRRKDLLLVVSVEVEIDQDAEEKPKDSTIEVMRFEEPERIDRDKLLQSGRVVSDLLRETLLLIAALGDETLVVSTVNQICLLDLELNVTTALDGEFIPVTMSLSDAGTIYLIVNDRDNFKLRAIRPNGERLFSVQLMGDLEPILVPPIIGYDNKVYVVCGDRLMAFRETGHYLWEYRAPSRIGGAAVSGDNKLLLASGSEIGAFDEDGRYETVFEFDEGTLQTAPSLMGDGSLLAATDSKLYRLEIGE